MKPRLLWIRSTILLAGATLAWTNLVGCCCFDLRVDRPLWPDSHGKLLPSEGSAITVGQVVVRTPAEPDWFAELDSASEGEREWSYLTLLRTIPPVDGGVGAPRVVEVCIAYNSQPFFDSAPVAVAGDAIASSLTMMISLLSLGFDGEVLDCGDPELVIHGAAGTLWPRRVVRYRIPGSHTAMLHDIVCLGTPHPRPGGGIVLVSGREWNRPEGEPPLVDGLLERLIGDFEFLSSVQPPESP